MTAESKYERIRRVGIGSYGIVFKCVDRQTGQIVAIKRYSESDFDPVIRKIASREVRFLRALKHPNLIDLIEVFRRKRRLHLVFDYCELTLLDVIEKYTNACPLSLIKRIVWQTVNAVSYCHSKNCIHRDIKPENILISKSGVVKLCDFGFARSLAKSATVLTSKNVVATSGSKHIVTNSSSSSASPTSLNNQSASSQYKENFQPIADNSNHYVAGDDDSTLVQQKQNDVSVASEKPSQRLALTEYVATRWYRAPELLIGDAYYDFKIDIWALGCVTGELIRGEPMWPAKTDIEQLTMIKNSLGSLTERQCAMLASQRVYDKQATLRLLAPQVYLPDPLDRKLPPRVGKLGFDFVSSCLQMDEGKRMTASQLLKHPFIHSSRVLQFSSSRFDVNNATVNDASKEANYNKNKLVATPKSLTPKQPLAASFAGASPVLRASVKRADHSSGSNSKTLKANSQQTTVKKLTNKKIARDNNNDDDYNIGEQSSSRKQTVIPKITTTTVTRRQNTLATTTSKLMQQLAVKNQLMPTLHLLRSESVEALNKNLSVNDTKVPKTNTVLQTVQPSNAAALPSLTLIDY